MCEQSQSVELQRKRHLPRGVRREVPPLEQQCHNRPAQNDEHGAGRDREEENRSQDGSKRVVESLPLVPRCLLGEGWKSRRRHSLGKHPLRQQHQHPGIVQRRKAPVAQAGREDRVHQEVYLDGGNADHTRPHEPENFPHAGIVETEPRSVLKAVAKQRRELDQEVPKGAAHDPKHKPIDSIPGCKEPRSQDYPQVVDGRSERREKEMLSGVQGRHHKPADPEDHAANEHPPHQARGQNLLWARKPGCNHVLDQRQGQQGTDDGDDRSEKQHPRRDSAEKPPRPPLVLPSKVSADGRYERGSKRTTGYELEYHIRQPESRVVSIELRRRTELGADHHRPDEAERLAQQERRHHDAGGFGYGHACPAYIVLSIAVHAGRSPSPRSGTFRLPTPGIVAWR